ncbi:CRAL-TRIO domain-containing protein [Dipodascopsis tothii]|uniref:CRAL-TRIO domain-containing protein n=1 Tax=Dipodascopsis tothii TaxID=44089 RepID=UPI0034CFCF13
MSAEELRVAFWDMVKADHPDGLLLRFLRARKWDTSKALVMMVSTMHWRLREMDVENLVFRGEGAAARERDEGFLKQVRMGKSIIAGRDLKHRPVVIVRARLHKPGDQNAEALERFTVYMIETARLCLKDPVDTAAVIIDLSQFSLANMDYAPVKFMIKCFEAHYPESLGVAIIYKAPWIFQGIWKVVKGWLDPVVASKISFARSPEDLAQHIESSSILAELGGPRKWSYNYIEPLAHENDKLEDAATRATLKSARQQIVTQYEHSTWDWILAHDQPGLVARRNALATDLRRNYIELDPYLRARTIYDRMDYA